MLGLRTQENEKFRRYFALIQQQAEKEQAVFFADAGDGHDLETQELECEDMMGWLIPEERAVEFEALWANDTVSDDWSDYYVWAVWYLENSGIRIRFEH